MNARFISPSLSVVILLLFSCGGQPSSQEGDIVDEVSFVNPVMASGSSPCLIYEDGTYYYTQATYTHVSIWSASSISGLKSAREQVVYEPQDTYYISGPRLYKFDGKWYLYYISEGGEQSMRMIHILENPSSNPLKGQFVEKNAILTGNVKSVHPSVFDKDGKLFLLWSGSDVNPGSDILMRSIYIARLANPWTPASKGIRILSPSYEWECQWVSEDGTSSPGPSYVCDAPQMIFSRDKSKILLYYSASETITSHYCEGLAYTSSDSDLMSPDSWSKLPEPVFSQNADSLAFGTGHVSFFQNEKDSLYILYNAYSERSPYNIDNRSTRMQQVHWSKDGIPELGCPISCSTPVRDPYL